MHFVSFLWTGSRGYTVDHVNKQHASILKHATRPFEYTCYTDVSGTFDPAINVQPLPDVGLNKLMSRLWLFSDEAAFAHPGRVHVLDLDTLVLSDLTVFEDLSSELTMYKFTESGWFGGVGYTLDTGTRTHVWRAAQTTTETDDQRFLNATISRDNPTYGPEWGVKTHRYWQPGDGARLVHMTLAQKPWHKYGPNLYANLRGTDHEWMLRDH